MIALILMNVPLTMEDVSKFVQTLMVDIIACVRLAILLITLIVQVSDNSFDYIFIYIFRRH